MRAALRVVIVALALARAAGAVECVTPVGAAPSLGVIPAEARLTFLRGELARAAHRARIWSLTWISLFAAGAVGEVALLAVYPPDARIDSYVAASAAVLALAAQLVLPPRSIADHRWLEARIARMPSGDPCAHLADAERLLQRDADAEVELTPLLHAANFLLNIAGGLVIGIVGGRWNSALIQIFAGSAIGETLILTQPHDASDALTRYRAGDVASRRASGSPRVALAPSLGRDQYGLALTLIY